MKIAYIVGSYTSKYLLKRIWNIWKARKVAFKYWKLGYVVICPHSNTAFFDGFFRKGPIEESFFLKGYLHLIEVADLLVVLPTWKVSSGSIKEIDKAQKLGIEIIYE